MNSTRLFGRLALSRTLAFLASMALAATGQAATVTWSAFPENGLWSNGNNWNGGLVPKPGDDLVFSISYFPDTTMTNDLADGIAFRSITFEANGYTLGGNAITFVGGLGPFTIGCTTAVGPENNTISIPIVASGNLLLKAVPGCSLTLNGPISAAGGLTAWGGGPVILGGDQSYTGATETALEGGFLIIDATLSGTSSVEIHASSGTSTLGGSGTFTAPLSVSSTSADASVAVAPGQNPGTGILSTGGVSFGLNASLVVELNGTTAGTGYDQLSVTGGIDLSGGTTLAVASLGFVPPIGTAFTIIRNSTGASVSGEFVGLPEGATFVKNTTTFQISYFGGAGHDIVLTVVPTPPAPAAPAALAVDSGGNGVLEPGELAALEPTWTNTSGEFLFLAGATANLTGPSGPVYDNPDADGFYGPIADGASAQCNNCYSVQITSSSRPALHWDATIEETVIPGYIDKTWTLHVGESFGDVPTSQQFYAFIENLFHNGVTAGCWEDSYCPDQPVTRAQMAVFLLKGEHGSAQAPPDCSSTVFTDEPCPGGPFVDWVNQIASEGITAGCGDGKYCPDDPVTRGQMAVLLLKGEHGGSYAPSACVATVFIDVLCPGAQFVDWINQLASEGVTGGCGDGKYCPDDPVNRGQMAVFLVKTFGLLLYGP